MNARDLPWQQFICRVCGLVYDERVGDPDGGLPPGTRFADIPDDWACPICGVGKADFEPHVPAPATAAVPSTGTAPAPRGHAGVVIVGAGRAGWQVAQALRERDGNVPITMVSACNGDVYDKPLLSVAVARGLTLERLVRESAAQAAQRLGLRLLSDTHAVAIDAPRQRLRTTRGTLRYRQLVLAHGAAPALPAAWPADAVWRINDLGAYRRLRSALGDAPRRLALIGAGLVGCELANDLALAGHAITLIDQQPLPLGALLPPEASQRLQQAWAALPITFIGGAQVAQVARGQVRLADGACIDVDAVIAATGLRTPSRLARSAGLAFDEAAGGIVVDPLDGRTSQPAIHALGDCVVVRGRASRFIEPIGRQAQAIAASLLGLPWAAAEPAAEPVLRIKTSSLPITLRGGLVSAGAWQQKMADQSVARS